MAGSNNLKEQLMRDKKKLGMMLVLVAVGLLLWGRLLLKDRVPKVASADQPQAVTSTTPVMTNNNVSNTTDHIQRPVVYVEFPDTLDRDLFVLDQMYQSQDDSSGGHDEQPNSGQELTDNQLRREAIRKEASGLSLQSVFKGSRPGVMINGKVLNVGQKINGFTVVKIYERRVIVRKHGVDIKLVLD